MSSEVPNVDGVPIYEIDFEGQHVAALVGYLTIACLVVNDIHDRILQFITTNDIVSCALLIISVFTGVLLVPVSFALSATADNMKDQFANFAGLLVVIEVDNVIGEIVMKYVENCDDESFFEEEVIESVPKIAKNIAGF